MGKRKSSKPPPKKQKPKLATQFACPFCNTDNSVSCQFDRARDIGTVSCNACQVCLAVRFMHLHHVVAYLKQLMADLLALFVTE